MDVTFERNKLKTIPACELVCECGWTNRSHYPLRDAQLHINRAHGGYGKIKEVRQ